MLHPRCVQSSVKSFFSIGVALLITIFIELPAPARAQPNSSFELLQKESSRPAVLMVHGFTDSPYYMKDLARYFYEKGYNVIAPRLKGHGTIPQDLHDVKLADWRDDVANGYRRAREISSQVLLLGYSTGGGLVVDFHQRTGLGEALILFAPAIKLKNPLARFTCNETLRNSFGEWIDDREEDNPVKYRKMSLKASCEVWKLTQDIRNQPHIRVPVFNVVTEYDDFVSSTDAIEFLAKNETSVHNLWLYNQTKLYSRFLEAIYPVIAIRTNRRIRHVEITLKENEFIANEENEYLDEILSELAGFLLKI